MRRALTCDIETYRIDDAEQYLDPLEPIEPPDLSAITAAKNLVDPAKIAADIEKRKLAAVADHLEQCRQQELKRIELLERCALDPDLCRIVACGWMHEHAHEPTVLIAQDDAVERYALTQFWQAADGCDLVTFNGLAFDLIILMRRSLYLGIEHPILNIDRYRTNHVDLHARLSHNGLMPRHSLKFYLSRFNIPCDDLTTGKDIAGLVEANDWPAVMAHCAADVRGTHALAQRLGYLQASAQPELALKDAVL